MQFAVCNSESIWGGIRLQELTLLVRAIQIKFTKLGKACSPTCIAWYILLRFDGHSDIRREFLWSQVKIEEINGYLNGWKKMENMHLRVYL